ncbi:hypothetical protein CUT44_21420 [Streptomyces carminius]|uniref:YcxB-like protein domain-containing protein n=1 Tax=Streptomyces carminius TaxID=2665496 RepID=A0A2M8LV53_9ACTN|nr:YcxB family protein [Streptomyces carminius]PJE95815.1 hypothetical protein CUT44_21420 [Streptomyces carminius]
MSDAEVRVRQAEPVELVYRQTAEDFDEALRVRARRARRDGPLPYVLLPAVMVGVVVSVSLVTDNPVLTAFTVAGGAIGMVFGLLRERAVRRAQTRELLRFAEAQGEYRTTVDDAGLHVTGTGTSSSFGWELYDRYVETVGLFVLLNGKGQVTGFAALPKRGARDADGVDRLRGILDRHLVRVT